MNLGSLRTRIIIGAVGSALLAVVMVWLSSHVTARLFLAELDRWEIPEEEIDQCEDDPEHWQIGIVDRISGYAYDLMGSSSNPEAPPLEPELLARVADGGYAFGEGPRGRISVHRVRPGGPCAVVRVEFSPPRAVLRGMFISVLVATLFTMLLAAWASYRFTVLPLVRRIHRIRDAARGVGSDAYRPPGDPVKDALAEISKVLDRSNARILEDREELVRRHEALEKHLAEIAHDLRTPLASLLLAVEEVSDEVDGEEAREAVARAIGDAAYVSDLIDNLHQATRLRQGLNAAEGEVDLCEVVERLGIRFRAIARHEGIEVAASIPDDPVPARCSPALAERAIANLVHNAVVHNEKGGHVAVVLEGGPRFTLTVLDDGRGLPDEEMADLQERTFRADDARQRGPGLGLAITNEVARRVGWEIRYESVEPRGLKVTIEGPSTRPSS